MQNRLRELIKRDTYRMNALQAARELQLPNWYLAAGFVRNLVWDELHGFDDRTPLTDVDVIYFNPGNITKEIEAEYEATLLQISPGYPWSVKNQARMHLSNNDDPYKSVHDAMSRWPETATAVGVRLEADNTLTVIAPYGVSDLYNLILRQSPGCRHEDIFNERIKSKHWLELWPNLTVCEQ